MDSRVRWGVGIAALVVLVVIAGFAVRFDESARVAADEGSLETSAAASSSASAAASSGSAGEEPGTSDDAASPGTPGVAEPVTPDESSVIIGSPVRALAEPTPGAAVYVDSKIVTVGQKYQVVFSPYGYWLSPDGAERLIVHVLEASSLGSPSSFSPADHDFVCVVDSSVKESVPTIDRYTGTLRFEPSGTNLVPILGNVAPYAD